MLSLSHTRMHASTHTCMHTHLRVRACTHTHTEQGRLRDKQEEEGESLNKIQWMHTLYRWLTGLMVHLCSKTKHQKCHFLGTKGIGSLLKKKGGGGLCVTINLQSVRETNLSESTATHRGKRKNHPPPPLPTTWHIITSQYQIQVNYLLDILFKKSSQDILFPVYLIYKTKLVRIAAGGDICPVMILEDNKVQERGYIYLPATNLDDNSYTQQYQ